MITRTEVTYDSTSQIAFQKTKGAGYKLRQSVSHLQSPPPKKNGRGRESAQFWQAQIINDLNMLQKACQ